MKSYAQIYYYLVIYFITRRSISMIEQEIRQEYDEYSFLIKAKTSDDFVRNVIFTKYDCMDVAKDSYRQAVKALNSPL